MLVAFNKVWLKLFEDLMQIRTAPAQQMHIGP